MQKQMVLRINGGINLHNVSSLTRHGEWSTAAAKDYMYEWINMYHTFISREGYNIATSNLAEFKVRIMYNNTSPERKFIPDTLKSITCILQLKWEVIQTSYTVLNGLFHHIKLKKTTLKVNI